VDDLEAIVVLLPHQRMDKVEDALATEGREIVALPHGHVHRIRGVMARAPSVRDPAAARIRRLAPRAATATAVTEATLSFANRGRRHLFRH